MKEIAIGARSLARSARLEGRDIIETFVDLSGIGGIAARANVYLRHARLLARQFCMRSEWQL